MKEFKLPSGAKLIVNIAPFSDAKELYQAVLSDFRRHVEFRGEYIEIVKNFMAAMNSSPQIETALWKCMQRSLYNGEKISPSVFEPIEAREDFMEVCRHVAVENLYPFTKGLFAEFQVILAKIAEYRKLVPEGTIPS